MAATVQDVVPVAADPARVWRAAARRYSVARAVTTPVSADPDADLLARLRRGDELAFRTLVERYSSTMLHVARLHVRDRQAAEEVVQETWLAVVRGLGRFEERSTLKTWLFRILVNRAKTRGVRENRSIPFASVGGGLDPEQDEGPTVDPSRFTSEGAWTSAPPDWHDDPELSLESDEALRIAREAIDRLPERQKIVITLRDLEGLSSDEVRNVLDLSESNQRVLLHRARTKVRQALEDWIAV